MRESASSHVLAVQLKRNIETGYLIPDSADVDFVRLAEYLCTGLTSEDCAWDSERASLQTIPKKRAKGKGKGKTTATRSSTFDKHQRQAKRMKLDDGIIEAGPQCTQVPALKHVFEICFIAEDKGERDCSEEERSLSCERDIIHSLIEKDEERGEGAIEIGIVFPHAYGGGVQLCTSGPLAQRLKNPIPFTSLFPKIIDENVKDTDFDFRSRTFKDILAAAYTMQQNDRPRITDQWKPSSSHHSQRTNLIARSLSSCAFKYVLFPPAVFGTLYPFKKAVEAAEEAHRRVPTLSIDNEVLLSLSHGYPPYVATNVILMSITYISLLIDNHRI